jgi:phage shock protein C
MSSEIRRLYRSIEEGRLAGVCGGIGVYFGIDPVFVRLGWVAATLLTGVVPGLVAYGVAWIIVPREPLPVHVARPPSPPERAEADPTPVAARSASEQP